MFEIKGQYTTAKVMIDILEEECINQITGFVNNPVFVNPVAIMPDAHTGHGSCIGFSMKMGTKIIPEVIGVDIGCGMESICIGKELPLSLELLDHRIREHIPFGFEIHHGKSKINMERDFPWKKAQVLAHKYAMELGAPIASVPVYDMGWFEEKSERLDDRNRLGRYIGAIGSLGGGNHFLEVGIDEEGNYWITIHTGSRNFGKGICDYWQHTATKGEKVDRRAFLDAEIDRIKNSGVDGEEVGRLIYEAKKRLKGMESEVVGKGWLEGDQALGYLFDMIFAQVYAEKNRDMIADIICKDILQLTPWEKIETVHNFIDFNDLIIRKGAIRSYIGEKMIIPFNMRDGILICEGKSNPEWNFSAPHGAGRVLSRTKARKTLDMEKFKKDMEGIFSTSVCKNTIDEAPDAYKDAAVIEKAIEPTATILHRIKPILNMKDTKGED
jgi:tRNA-splicing ligase RtcB (3'-phosphate/5'-hydroxy nucleic acid ligase)